MLSIHTRIDRAQRLVRMLERDAPLLAVRVAELGPERQQSAKSYAAQLTAHARAELEKLLEEGSYWEQTTPLRTPRTSTQRVGRTLLSAAFEVVFGAEIVPEGRLIVARRFNAGLVAK